MDDPNKSITPTVTLPAGKVYLSKLVYGEKDSDSVGRLQQALKRHKLTSSVNLPITSAYLEVTDAAVRACQKEHGFGSDPVKGSSVGPKQAAHLFAGTGNSVVDDRTKPPGPWVAKLHTALLGIPKVQYVVGWDDPDLCASGDWAPDHVTMHHTVGTNSLGWLKPGGQYKTAAGANFHIARDGTINVITAYRANHAGLGGPMDGVPKDAMNGRSWGIEVESLGKVKDFTDEQMESIGRLLKALLAMMKVVKQKIHNHRTWSSTGKVDTLYPDAFWYELSAGTFRSGESGAVGPPITTPPPVVLPPVPGPEALTKAEADKLYAAKNHTHPDLDTGTDLMWFDYTDKPGASQVVTADSEWHKVETALLKPTPANGREDHMLYVRINFRWNEISGAIPTTLMGLAAVLANATAKVECRFVRGDGDETAYDERHYAFGTKSVPFQQLHWEHGEKGLAGQWWIKVHGGVSSIELTTRYAKTNVIVAR